VALEELLPVILNRSPSTEFTTLAMKVDESIPREGLLATHRASSAHWRCCWRASHSTV
jgi:hypothetical protein